MMTVKITNKKENVVERKETGGEKGKKVTAAMTVQETERRETSGKEAPVIVLMMKRESQRKRNMQMNTQEVIKIPRGKINRKLKENQEITKAEGTGIILQGTKTGVQSTIKKNINIPKATEADTLGTIINIIQATDIKPEILLSSSGG